MSIPEQIILKFKESPHYSYPDSINQLMLNATNINFAVFNRYLFPDHLEGHFFSLFGIAIAAAETAVAIAIIINVYRNIKQVLTDDITDMKG